MNKRGQTAWSITQGDYHNGAFISHKETGEVLQKLGAEVMLCGPQTLMPRHIGTLGGGGPTGGARPGDRGQRRGERKISVHGAPLALDPTPEHRGHVDVLASP